MLLWARFFTPKVPNFWKTPELKKKKLGPTLGQDRFQKTSGGCLLTVRGGEIPSLCRQTSIDKTNDCVMVSERGSLARDSDPPQGHRIHTKTGDMWRALVRRMKKSNRSLVHRKQMTKILDPPRNTFFFPPGLREARRTPPASKLSPPGPWIHLIFLTPSS